MGGLPEIEWDWISVTSDKIGLDEGKDGTKEDGD